MNDPFHYLIVVVFLWCARDGGLTKFTMLLVTCYQLCIFLFDFTVKFTNGR